MRWAVGFLLFAGIVATVVLQSDFVVSRASLIAQSIPTGQQMICGDGIVQDGEQCDDGSQNRNVSGARCRADCTSARCGDGVLDSSEICDDGNQSNGDGCDFFCNIEAGDPGITVIGSPTNTDDVINISFPALPGVLQPHVPANVPSVYQQPPVLPTLPNIQSLPMQIPLAQFQPLIESHGPAGKTGPAAVAIIGAGIAGGVGWIRKRGR